MQCTLQRGVKMNHTAESVHPSYVEYVTQLHCALSMGPNRPVAEAYRVKRLSLEEFCIVWERWGETPDLQESWATRFSRGYVADARANLKRFNAVLANETSRAAA